MNCPNCGKETVAGAKFCGSCGAPLVSDIDGDASAPANADASSQAQQPQGQQAPGYAPYEPPMQPGAQNAGYYQPNAGTQQNYYQQPQGQAPYNMGTNPGAPYGQPASPYAQAGYQPGYTETTYPMSDTDRTLRLINFILCLISTIVCALAVIPLCWMIPMTVISWGIYKGKKRNTVAFGVCTLIFVNLIGGVLLLCSHKDN